MKKATSKRDRKFGKKDENNMKISKDSSERVVKVMVDYYTILKFKKLKEAEAYINKQHKESDQSGRPRTSFIIM